MHICINLPSLNINPVHYTTLMTFLQEYFIFFYTDSVHSNCVNDSAHTSLKGEPQTPQKPENTGLSMLPKSSQKATKSKPKTCDACVMTDIRFGTEDIRELTPLYQSQIDTISSLNDPPMESPSNGISSQTLPPPNKSRSSSPRPPRHDKCTSPLIPKLAIRNGVINGLSMNGSTSPVVRKNTRQRKRTKRKPPPPPPRSKTNFDKSSVSHNLINPLVEAPPPSEECRMQIHTKPQPRKKKLGSGKHGSRSFLVSIPRMYCSKKILTAATPPSKTSNGGDKSFSHHRSPGHRRRTEIQLLLDGDKPRGERLRVDQVPKFTAEDVTSWSKSSWLGSGARKIIPVEHLTYPPLSPSATPKRPSSAGSTSSSTTANHRKRSYSEDPFENSNITSPKLPRQKNVRLTSPSDSVPMLSRQQVSPQANQDLSTNDVFVDIESTIDDKSECLRVLSNDVFCGELVAFDSRGDCLLDNGDYTIIMQKCLEGSENEASDLLMFEPLTWSSVFSATQKVCRLLVCVLLSLY